MFTFTTKTFKMSQTVLKNAFRKNNKAKEEMKKDVLKKFTKFTGRPATLFKKRLGTGVFLRILRTF